MSESADDPIAALLASNRSGARSVEQGRFRLDWKRALDKVKRFQLTDPHRYILELVQGAVAGGASVIDVTTDADDVIFQHTSDALDELELAQLFDYLFAKDGELTALKQLAIGVNAALALEPKFIHVDVGDQRLRLTSHENVELVPLEGPPVDGVRVHVRDRISWKMIGKALRDTAEVRLLREHCRYSPIPIVVDGEELQRGFDVPAIVTQAFKAKGGASGTLAIPLKPQTHTTLQLCMNGVHIVTARVAAEAPWLDQLGMVGVVDYAGLSRNASHTDVHRDDRFRAICSSVNQAARVVLEVLLDTTLIGKPPATDEPLRHYQRLAARSLLRFDPKQTLSPTLDALLDLPDMVELAVSDHPRSSLRRVWQDCAARGTLSIAQRRYEVKLDELPDGMAPVVGPEWAVVGIFAGVPHESCDALLEEIERGRENQRKREALRREPLLGATEAIVRVGVKDEDISGEVGLDQHTAMSIAELVDANGAGVVPTGDGAATMMVVFMRQGVPMGARLVDARVLSGVALLESDRFEPNAGWTDLQGGGHVKMVTSLLNEAVPRLVARLRGSFAQLPPPEALSSQEQWRAGVYDPEQLLVTWPTDALAAAVRKHVDTILSRRTLDEVQVPGLRSWPIFHLLDRTAVTLDQIAGKAPVGDRVVPKDEWRLVIDEPWGDGAPRGTTVINATPMQREILARYLGYAITDAESAVTMRRLELEAEAEVVKRRKLNMERAEARRQNVELRRGGYEVMLELELEGGKGVIGLPVAGSDDSWIRYLWDGLPFFSEPLDTPIPVHAVVQSAEIEPDAAFEGVASRAAAAAMVTRIVDALPALMDAFIASPGATTNRGLELIWQWLEHCSTTKGLSPSEALKDYPLMATVSGERASLRQLRDSATAHSSTVRTVDISPGRMETEQPVAICGAERRRILQRLLSVRAIDYSRQLQREVEAMERKQRPTRAPRLTEPLLMSMPIRGSDDDDTLEGEIGVPAGSVLQVGEGGWVEVLVDRVPLERRSYDFDGLPFIALVSSARIRGNKNWTHVLRNAAWKKVEKALDQAAETMLLEGCRLAEQRAREFATPAMLIAFQTACSTRFLGAPERIEKPRNPLEEAMAAAPLWESVDRRDRISLRDITEYWRRTGRVWVIPTGEGELAPGRIIVRGTDATKAALAGIFHGDVKDGTKTFATDQEALRRRSAAPALDTRLVFCLESVPFEATTEDGSLSIRGEVACALPYPGHPGMERHIRATLGVDGRVLEERAIGSAVQCTAVVDCHGLEVNNAWTSASNTKQLEWIDGILRETMWKSVAAIAEAGQGLSGATPIDNDRRKVLIDALDHLAEDTDSPLREQLLRLPLFVTVQRQSLTGAQLMEGDDEVLYVGEHLDEGNPRDGRRLLRLPGAGVSALVKLIGDRAVRDDERWSTELEGARRFESLLPSTPSLQEAVAASVFFQTEHTYGTAGLLLPSSDALPQDSADPSSRIRIHVGGRPLVTHELTIHPPIEAWVNDSRLTPDEAFRDVARDEIYTEVIALVSEQRDELVARAAETLRRDAGDRLRARVCRFIMDRHKQLAKQADAAPRSPAARMLEAPLWRCLTGARIQQLSTNALRAAHEQRQLATADEDSNATAAEHGKVVVLASKTDLVALRAGFGLLEDYTKTLEELAARREFLDRRAVSNVDLDAIGTAEPFLFRRHLTDPGWEGEIGLPARVGRGLEVTVLVEHRPVAVMTIPASLRAVAVVQREGLSVTPRYDAVVDDQALARMVEDLQRAAWETMTELARRLPQMSRHDVPTARRVLIDALGGTKSATEKDPAFARMEQALEQAPLFEDVTGQVWSPAALRAGAENGEPTHAVSPETAAMSGGRTGPSAGPVIVLQDASWVAANRVLPFARSDIRFLENAEGQRRREAAATTYRIPRRAIAVAAIDSPMFSGTLGLSVPPGQGEYGIFSHGRQVMTETTLDLIGLVGWIDGALEADRSFTRVHLSPVQRTELRRLWRQRLELASAELVAYDGRRSGKHWNALRHYATHYLLEHMDELGSTMEQRRTRVLTPVTGAHSTLDEVAAVPMIRTNEGEWVGLNELVGGDDPTVVVTEDRVKRPPAIDARFVIGDDATLKLVSALLGAAAVMDLAQATEAVAKTAASRKAKAEAEAAREARRRESSHAHTLSALTSFLRDACGSTISLDAIKSIRVESLGGDDLLRVSESQIVVNQDSELWQQALSARQKGEALVIAHLAIAVACALPGTDDPHRTIGLLSAVAKHLAG